MGVTYHQLGPLDAEPLKKLLLKEPAQNLYLLGLLEEFGVTPAKGRAPHAFFARVEGATVSAALFVGGDGGLLVPSASEASHIGELANAIANRVKLKSCLGEKPAVDELVRRLANGTPLFSRTQRLFSVSADDLGPFTNPTLRLAVESDLDELLPMAAHSVQERLERDPLAEDRDGFSARVLLRIRSKRTYVLPVNGRLVFKIDVGSRSASGAELEGLYTLPSERRKGHATLSLGQISRHLLSSLPRLSLRVDDLDPSLAGVARKVGYLAGRTQRLVVAQ